MTINGNFERFQNFNFETDFLENESLFQKIGVPLESLKSESTSFLNKAAISEANDKAIRMMGTKWTYHKKTEFCQQILYFFENLVSV